MTATFGRLENKTLALGDGLNLLCAPNEAGKSTWCTFLVNMLYGLPTRVSGPLADKNHYAPWSGAPMQGLLELEADGRRLTLTRDTARASAPMGRFHAVYTGTSEPVPGLTGQTCGETLLGVPREVFERSAFIRQAGMAVGQTAELERRIVALITTGDEDTSYIEAHERLKKQLNRRRSNRTTGQLPALEAELEETRRQLEELEVLEAQLSATHASIENLSRRQSALEAQLTLHDQWSAMEQSRARSAARRAVQEAEDRVDALHRRLEAERVPENDAISRLRAAIVNLETVRRGVDRARAERDDAQRALYRAEAAVSESPFAGLSAEEARRAAQTATDMRCKQAPAMVVFGAAKYLCVVLTAALIVYLANRPGGTPLLPVLGIFVLGVAGGLMFHYLRLRAVRKARNAALEKRFGTADPAALSALADAYCDLLAARDAAQADAAGKSGAVDALSASLTTNEQGILLEVRRFAPAAFDIPAADAALRSCAVRRREMTEAETAAREARLRYEYQLQQSPEVAEAAQPEAPPPQESRETLTDQLEDVRASLAAARSTADQLTGRLHAVGDYGDLRAAVDRLGAQKAALEEEYEALALALEALSAANTSLQNRFSPALGQRAAEIFSRLTGGRYHKILLDRQLSASAEAGGDPLPRDARLLSQGAFDQLYLSLRLAICDLVVPEDKRPPLILDDALTSFDDDRARAALDYLKEVAQRRQVLLFTCQGREAEFLSGDPAAAIQTLS